MKQTQLVLILILWIGMASAKAQETKSKPSTTTNDKVHNVIHPEHKVAHGVKHKHESATGKKLRTWLRRIAVSP